MSPEQWGEMPRDGNPEVDGRTDIYSLGVIFFELVAGRKPLGGRTLSELRHKHVTAPLPTLAEVAAGVPEAFSRGVAHAMAKDRSDRPQAAGDFIDELRAALGLATRSRGHGIHATDAGQTHATDAGHAPATRARASQVGDAATANLSPETNAEHLDHSHADTILTSDFESPAKGPGRETTAGVARPFTDGNVAARLRGGRETVAERADATQSGATADAQQHPYDESQNVFQQGAAQQGAGVSITAPEPRRSFAPLIAGGALALLIVLGVGGWFVWSRMRAKPEAGNPPPPSTEKISGPASPVEAPKVEAASYWFEAFDKPEDAEGKRIADTSATLVSGQRFRFHFTPKERGHRYLLGPGAGRNAPVDRKGLV